jgi:hypothetical protein
VLLLGVWVAFALCVSQERPGIGLFRLLCLVRWRSLAGSPAWLRCIKFGDMNTLKYISTQFDLKRKPAHFLEECVSSTPWSDVSEMETYIKRYVNGYPWKVYSETTLQAFEGLTSSKQDARLNSKAWFRGPLSSHRPLPEHFKVVRALCPSGCERFQQEVFIPRGGPLSSPSRYPRLPTCTCTVSDG